MKGAVEVSMCISYTPDPARNKEVIIDPGTNVLRLDNFCTS